MIDKLNLDQMVRMYAELVPGCTVPVYVTRKLCRKTGMSHDTSLIKMNTCDLAAVTEANPCRMHAAALASAKKTMYAKDATAGMRIAGMRPAVYKLLDLLSGTRHEDDALRVMERMDGKSEDRKTHIVLVFKTVTLADLARLAINMSENWNPAGIRVPDEAAGQERALFMAWAAWASSPGMKLLRTPGCARFNLSEFMRRYAPEHMQAQQNPQAAKSRPSQQFIPDRSVNDDMLGDRTRHGITADAVLRYRLVFDAPEQMVCAVAGMLDMARYGLQPQAIEYGNGNILYVAMDCMDLVDGWPSADCAHPDRLRDCSRTVDQIYEDICTIIDTVRSLNNRGVDQNNEVIKVQ